MGSSGVFPDLDSPTTFKSAQMVLYEQQHEKFITVWEIFVLEVRFAKKIRIF